MRILHELLYPLMSGWLSEAWDEGYQAGVTNERELLACSCTPMIDVLVAALFDEEDS